MKNKFEYHDYKEAFEEGFGTRSLEKTAHTSKQRRWIMNMWDTMYGAPEGKHACVGYSDDNEFGLMITFRDKIQLHHIVPQRYGQRTLGMNRHDLSAPTNLMPTSPEVHVGKGYKGSLDHRNGFVPIIHPDMAWANRHYYPDKTSFKEVFKGRNAVVEEGDAYWNEQWDSAFVEKAEEVYYRYCCYLTAYGIDDPYPMAE